MEKNGPDFKIRWVKIENSQDKSRVTALEDNQYKKKWKCYSLRCVQLCNPMDHSLPGSSIHGILWARILEWVAISFSRGPSLTRDWAWVSHTTGRFFTIWATREAIGMPKPGPKMTKKKKSVEMKKKAPTGLILQMLELLLIE